MRYFDFKNVFINSRRAGVLLVFLLFFEPVSAQTENANELLVSCTNSDSVITLNYHPVGMVYNLLVQISDSGGRTVFLENKYKFSGNYQCTYNASLWKQDVLYVQLIADEKHFYKKIKLR